MAGRTIGIRLGIDGAAEAKAALESFGRTGTAVTSQIKSSLDALSAGDLTGKFATSLGAAAAKLAAAQRALLEVPPGDTAGIAAAQQKVAAATDTYTAALTRKRAQLVPAAAAEQTLAKAIADVDAAERLSAVGTGEAAAARQRAQAGYNQTIKSLKDVGTGSGAASASMRGLGIQTIQAISGIATGQPILTTLIQQSHQVADQALAMGTGFGGIATAAKGMISAVGGIPTLLGVGVVGGLIAVGAAAENEAARLSNLRQSLRLTHDDYASLADTVDAGAKRVAASSNLSRSAAEDIYKTIASSRYLGSFAGDLDNLTKSAADFARVAGTDGVQSAKLYRQAIDEPAAAAEAMASLHLPAMTTALLRTIVTLDASGDHAKASALALDTLRTSTKGAAEDVSPLSKAMTALGNAFSTTGANGKSFAAEIGTFVTNDLATFLNQLTDLVHKAQDLRDWIGSKSATPATPITGGGLSYSQQLLQGSPDTFNQIQTIGQANKIPEAIIGLATRVAYRESGGQQYDTLRDPSGKTLLSSDGKHFGIGQLDAGTARDMNVDYTTVDGNILGMLKRLYQISQDPRLNANEGTISGAYNMGPQGMADVLAGKRALPDETDRYTQAVAGVRVQPLLSAAAAATALPAVAVSASRYPDSVERALSPFTKLGSEGTPEATQAAAKADIDKYTAAINDLKAAGETAGPTMDRLQQLLSKARGEFANAIGPINSVTRGITDQLAPLQAESGAARAVAEAINQQVLAARGSGRTVTDGQAEAARAAVLRNLAAAFNDVVTSTDRSTAANLRIAGTLDQGAASFVQATNREKALAQARDDYLPGPEQDAAVDRYTAALNRQSASVVDLASAQKAFDQRDQLAVLQLETASLGQNADLRDKEIALLQAKQALIKQGADLDSAASKTSLANLAAISDATAALKGQKAALSELTNFVDGTFSTISDSIVSAFATGEQSAVKFKDVVGSVIKAVEAEFVKLALVNPLKNLLLGSTSPTLTSVGGIIGQLLGNSSGGSSSSSLASPFDGAGIGFGSSGSTTSANAASNLGLSDIAGAAGTFGTLAKGVDYLTGGHLVADISSGLKNTFQSASSFSIYSSAPTSVSTSASTTGQTVAAGAVDDFSSAGGTLSGANSSGVNLTAGSALGIVGGLYGAYSGFERGGLGGTVQGIGGIASAGFAAAGAGLLGSGAAGLAAAAGPYAPIALAAIAIIGALLPGAHPIHPFQDTEVDVSNGHLTVGKTVSQVESTSSAVQAVNDYSASLDQFMTSAGLRLTNIDSAIGHIGENVTGLVQVSSPDALFNKLQFANDPSDTSNFGVAKGALDGMKFQTFQDLGAELQKIASFADAASLVGIKLQSVSTDLTNIRIAGVTQNATLATTTIKDAEGNKVTYKSDLREALNEELPKLGAFADTGALDAQIQKISNFLTSTIPSLLTPIKSTQSTLMDQYNEIQQRYAVAAQQSKNYGLDNTDVLLAASNKALAILMEPATRALRTVDAAVNVRFATQAFGAAGSGRAVNDNLAMTQVNERAQFEDQWRQTWGDSVVASGAYRTALQNLITTQNMETEATKQQIELARMQSYASLTATEADIAKRAGVDDLAAQLSAYDAKASAETASFIKSWRDYYGQYAATGEDFQSQMIALYTAHYTERLQIEQNYTTESNTALKTAQGSVASLFGSIKDYALKLQTGSQSALSPTAQYDLAKSQFNAVSGAALAGDATSAQQLTTYADALLSTSQAVNGSGTGYADDYSRVLDVLQGITTPVDALTQSFMQQQLQSQTDQVVSTLQETSADLKAELAALRREMQAQTRSNAG